MIEMSFFLREDGIKWILQGFDKLTNLRPRGKG